MLGVVRVTNRVNILGCEFDPWTTVQTIDKIEEFISNNQQGYLCTVNVSILMMMRSDLRLAEFVTKSCMTVADGQPLIKTSNYLNTPLPERVTGVELVDDLASLAKKNNWGIYLLGATQEIVSTVASRLEIKHSNTVISGFSDGYFDKEGAKNRVQEINNSEAKILIVAMGVPRQEIFIEENWQDLNTNFIIGVGGSFDVISGVTKRAPVWMQKASLEWLYRTMQEPRRLFWRYLSTNSKFIYLFIKEIVLGINKNQVS
jgi:N-acetylglucosaminyldiphosphoundecaprenol N-acetyl-beta-D-mannosaminyltransferase